MNFDISLKIRNNRLYVHYYEDGVLFKRSLKLDATKPNIAYANKHIIPSFQLRLARGLPVFSDISISAVFENLMKRYEFKSSSTLDIYRRGFRYFFEYFGDRSIDSFRTLELDKYIEYLSSRLSSSSVHVYLAPVSLVFIEALRLDYIHRNPFTYSIKPKNDTARRRVYTVTQVWQLLDTAEPKLKTYLFLGFFTGMRIGEILALRWSDIDLYSARIAVTKSYHPRFGLGLTKTGKSRYLPIFPKLLEYLASLERVSDSVVPLTYQTISKKMRSLCNSLGFFYEGTHNLRHTFASLMLRAQENPLFIKELLGQSVSSKMLEEVYSHYIEDNRDSSAFNSLLERRSS